MKGNFKQVISMVWDVIRLHKVNLIKALIKMAKNMVLEFLHGPIEIDLRGYF